MQGVTEARVNNVASVLSNIAGSTKRANEFVNNTGTKSLSWEDASDFYCKYCITLGFSSAVVKGVIIFKFCGAHLSSLLSKKSGKRFLLISAVVRDLISRKTTVSYFTKNKSFLFHLVTWHVARQSVVQGQKKMARRPELLSAGKNWYVLSKTVCGMSSNQYFKSFKFFGRICASWNGILVAFQRR